MRAFYVLFMCTIIASLCLFMNPLVSRGQASSPKALIQLDQPKVDVEFNLTGVNFATFTGSVILDLNESEEGYVELEGDAGGWALVISPRAFYVPTNTTNVDFIVEVSVPPEIYGGIIQMLNVSGSIITSEDNTMSHALEPAQGIISVSPVYSVGIEFRQPMVEVPPGSLVVLQALINNFASEGLFIVGPEIGTWFQEIGSSFSVSSDILWIDSQGTGIVNITMDLPDEFTIWIDRADTVGLSITTENGTWLDSSHATVRVRGIYAGLLESTICMAILLIIVFLVITFETFGDKELRKKIRKLKMEKKIEKKIKKRMEKKGLLFTEKEDGLLKDIEDQPIESVPLSCPLCYSENVKILLSGKFKCKNCERLFDKEDSEPPGQDGTQQGP